jgi:hypothetical protein
MRALVNRARTIGLALVAGLLTFEAVFALSAGAIGIPHLFLIRLSRESGAPFAAEGVQGGETVIAKLGEIAGAPRHVTQREATQPEAPAAGGEPNLAGLAEIPVDMPWKHEAKSENESKDPPQKAFSPDAKGREELPWDAVEPVPPPSETSSITPASPAPQTPIPAAAPAPRVAPARLPASSDVEGWVKAKATEIKGEDRGRPLYHFELWLDAPAEVKQRLVAVAYDFNTPAVMPQMQVSSEQKTGFRVSVGGLACADKITVTLKFNDGQSQQVAVDGCRLLG